MSFLSPLWLFALWFIPLYLLGVRRYKWHFQGWLLLSLACLILSLGRPVVNEKPISVEEAGSDVILALDMSYSMRATDITPSRLGAAKRVLREVVESDSRDRFGVLAHTTSAIVLSPLTKDSELLKHLFSSLDESQIITKGTEVMGALELSRKMSHAQHPLVVLFTDGGDELSYEKESAYAQEHGLKVCVVMLASAQGSTLQSDEGLLKDEGGHIVVSSRNEAINQISSMSGGKVIEGADSKSVLEWIERERGEDFAGSTTVTRYKELFYIPLILGMIAFVLAYTTLGERVVKKIIPLLTLIGISLHAGVLDYPYQIAGEMAYSQGKYEHSAKWFGYLDSAEGKFNRAASLYKGGKYPEALAVYRSIRSDNPMFKSYVYYNMGNCYIRLNEFENARNALLKSLTLHYSHQADQNLKAIAIEQEQKSLNVRKEKKDKFSSDENKPAGEGKKTKEGGGSNMQSDIASSGAGDAGKKVQADPRFSLSQGKAALSSHQYELINQRSVHETKPW
ncbi:MAG: VWA domain-containing protein [Sulfuricurvum sp.]|uniref:VWA domain-containing protein n=1 Tax=Sulfuricurvum sp. TaxID=2025608 RepID=UPI002619CAF1|nr:VWA domain-containing protein [Sulfuricurvum sp.]MDD2829387.1 VWA domain-containing protein [Sulfuricurvum sp.]MDD4949122.1 VWA domain-containing protein [Sulfuricurvum sp.]